MKVDFGFHHVDIGESGEDVHNQHYFFKVFTIIAELLVSNQLIIALIHFQKLKGVG